MVRLKICSAFCGVVAGMVVADVVEATSENAISLASGGRMSVYSEATPCFDSRTKTVADSNASNLNARKTGLVFYIR